MGYDELDFSWSASLHCCEQYGPSGESRSQKRQQSWKHCMVVVVVLVVVVVVDVDGGVE